MNRRPAFLPAAVLFSGLAVIKVSANGFGLPDQDAFATARGEAFAATADNPSAIFYNPAGITQLTGDNFRGGLDGIYLDPTFQPPPGAPNSGKVYHVQNNLAAVPQFFYTHSLKELPLSFGLGLYAPNGGSLSWPADTGFSVVATKGSLLDLRLNPVLAWQILPGLSVAAGASVDYMKLNLEQDLLAAPTRFANFFEFTGEGWTFGYNLGLLWQPVKKVSIGATFRSQTSVKFDGHTEYELQPLPNLSAQDGRHAYGSMTFPMTAVLGVSYRPSPKWNLETDANYTDWSSVGTMNIFQDSPPRPFNEKLPVILGWRPSWLVGFGATRYLDNGWHVSAGYAFSENSVPDGHYTPLAADLDRHFLSVGFGHQGKTLAFDIAYQFGYGPDHTVTGSQPSSKPASFANEIADGVYAFISHSVLVSVGLRF
ncbi:MAG: outer membrane protein transport protein [Verrucomicrobiae bacterium]|nr:outer membrane protein transport protein [Verrucomicrobiae bacterium]